MILSASAIRDSAKPKNPANAVPPLMVSPILSPVTDDFLEKRSLARCSALSAAVPSVEELGDPLFAFAFNKVRISLIFCASCGVAVFNCFSNSAILSAIGSSASPRSNADRLLFSVD